MKAALLCAGSISCLLVATPALAQNQDQTDPGASPDIVVTANRREETLQKVPAAITAISGETLARDNITSLEGVADKTPGLTFAAFAAGQP